MSYCKRGNEGNCQFYEKWSPARQLFNIFDEIDFYETLLKGLQKNNGEFYTPRAITTFIVDKIDTKIGEKGESG